MKMAPELSERFVRVALAATELTDAADAARKQVDADGAATDRLLFADAELRATLDELHKAGMAAHGVCGCPDDLAALLGTFDTLLPGTLLCVQCQRWAR